MSGTSSRNKRILVIGATGQQGTAAARHLLEDGWGVRAFTRDRSKPQAMHLADLGASVVEGDLDDAESIRKAMQDCFGVFCVLTFFVEGVEGEVRQGRRVAQVAADCATIRHFVYSSVGSADQETGIPHFESKWKVEQSIRQARLPWTMIRPVWFMDNFRNWYIEPMRAGKLSLPIDPAKPLQMVAVEDIGRVAAHCFAHPDGCMNQAIELAGDSLTLPQAAMMMNSLVGRPVTYVRQDIEDVRRQNPDFAAMYEWFDQHGYRADIQALRARYPFLMTFADYLTWTAKNSLTATTGTAARI